MRGPARDGEALLQRIEIHALELGDAGLLTSRVAPRPGGRERPIGKARRHIRDAIAVLRENLPRRCALCLVLAFVEKWIAEPPPVGVTIDLLEQPLPPRHLLLELR